MTHLQVGTKLYLFEFFSLRNIFLSLFCDFNISNPSQSQSSMLLYQTCCYIRINRVWSHKNEAVCDEACYTHILVSAREVMRFEIHPHLIYSVHPCSHTNSRTHLGLETWQEPSFWSSHPGWKHNTETALWKNNVENITELFCSTERIAQIRNHTTEKSCPHSPLPLFFNTCLL